MKKLVIIVGAVVLLAAAAFYSGIFNRESAQAAGQEAAAGQGRGGGGRGGPGGRGGFGGPMTVEVAVARRQAVKQELTVVGNLIGDTTVAVVPRAAGRLEHYWCNSAIAAPGHAREDRGSELQSHSVKPNRMRWLARRFCT